MGDRDESGEKVGAGENYMPDEMVEELVMYHEFYFKFSTDMFNPGCRCKESDVDKKFSQLATGESVFKRTRQWRYAEKRNPDVVD